MRTIEYTCKLCKQPRNFKIREEDICDEQWMDTFRKMLTCNPCHDLREKFRTAERHIIDACTKLVRTAIMKMPDEMRYEIKKKCRAALIISSRRYAEAMAQYRNLESVMWTEDFVDQLEERPEYAFDTLKKYRQMLKALPRLIARSEPDYRPPQADA